MNTRTQTKPISLATLLTFNDATEKALAFAGLLASHRLHFTLSASPEMKWFHIVGVKDADLIKHLIPQASIEVDQHKRRFAEIWINYA